MKNLIPWKKKNTEVEVVRPHDDPTFDLTRGMADTFNQLFRRFDEEWNQFLTRGGPAFGGLPNVDVSETDDEVRVSADLPGLDEKDIKVSLDGDVLTISGERRYEHEEKRKHLHRVERSYGTFHRSIALPEEIDRENVKATFKKGVLHVTIAKRPGAKPSRRRIPVSTG